MKVARTFTIEAELAERLMGEKNQSATINELLKEYFSIEGSEEDAIKQSMKIIEEEIEKAQKSKDLLIRRSKKLVKRQENIQKQYKNIPKEVLDDLKNYPKMDVETLKVRFDGIYKFKHRGLVWTDLIKAWRKWHGIGK